MRVMPDDAARIRTIYETGSPQDRANHVRRVVQRAWFVGIAANTIAATMTGVIQGVTAQAYLEDEPLSQFFHAFVTIGGSLYAFAMLATYVAARVFLGQRLRWFVESRPPSRGELERLAKLPRWVATANVIAWAVFDVMFLVCMIHVAGYSYSASDLLKQIATHGYGFVVGTALVYVVIERVFSPYLQLALPSDVREWPPLFGIAQRLLATWFAVAGAPLILITFLWIGWTDEQRDLAAPGLRLTSVLAVVVGLLAFAVAGRTITMPLTRLQNALRLVATGDLTPRVEVDEATELGHVEAGFNHMVDGLQELASDNTQLQTELQRQLEAVQASRVRIVEAADAERARIERNLHDGAQQRLLSLSFALGAAERNARDGDGDLEQTLRAARSELDAAMSELRELARGIHPAILDEEGLGPALGSLAERAPVPTQVITHLSRRLPSAVEVTAYFVVAESLANIAKYADASRATLDAAVDNGSLRLEVSDDGRGGADPRRGSGLRGLTDRVAALGGELTVDSEPGHGTRVVAVIPCK